MDKITEDKFTRFKDSEWFDTDKKQVLIGGAGGISSWLALLISRAGMMVYIYDFDLVEQVNLAGQLYGNKHVGQTKVDAIANVIKEFADEEIFTYCEKIDNNTMSNPFVLCGFDNMKARKDTFEGWVESNIGNSNAIFIDGRLNMEQCQVFCVHNNSADIERYKTHLFEDSEVPDASCTAKQTSHAAALIAATMTSYFVNHLTNIKAKQQKRTVPFFWELYMPLDIVSNNPEE